MSDIRELYQQVIIDHGRRPRNFGELPDATHIKEGHNPLCGDTITLYLKIQNGMVEKAGFNGKGCAISIASASLMTQMLTGLPEQEALQIFEAFQQMVTHRDTEQDHVEKLGKLAVLKGVCEYPSRVKCATLAWHTMHSAICGDDKEVSTE